MSFTPGIQLDVITLEEVANDCSLAEGVQAYAEQHWGKRISLADPTLDGDLLLPSQTTLLFISSCFAILVFLAIPFCGLLMY